MVKGIFKDDPWTQRFKELLGERDYVAIKSLQMQGLLLVLFTKREHLLHVREVESEYTRTGLGGMWVRIDVVYFICQTYFHFRLRHYIPFYQHNNFNCRAIKALLAFDSSYMEYPFVWSILIWLHTIKCLKSVSKILKKSSTNTNSIWNKRPKYFDTSEFPS